MTANWIGLACLCLTIGTGLAADTYYVAPAGDDGNPGAEARPFASLKRAEEAVEPGDTVVFEDGLYNLGRAGLELTKAGAPGKPITWRARRPGQATLRNSERVEGFERYKSQLWRARLDRCPASAYMDGDALYRRWEYKFDGPDDPRIQRGHWQWFDGWLYLWPWDDADPNGHEIDVSFDSIVKLMGSASYRVFEGLTFEHGYAGLKWQSAASQHNVVRNCLFVNSNMGIGGGSHSLIEHCTFYNIGPSKFEHGIYDGHEGTTIRYCHFERISGGALHLYKKPKDIMVCYNTIGPPKRRHVVDPTFAGMHVGIYAWGRGGHHVHHNVIYGGHRVGISLFAPNSVVEHNTIVGATRWGLLLLKGMAGNRVASNVVSTDVGLFTACGALGTVLDDNLYAGQAKWSWGGAGHKGGREAATLDAWRRISGQAAHSRLVAGAHFVDAPRCDYRLAPGSPAVGAFERGKPWPERPGVSFAAALWRTYEVYQPRIERTTVVDGDRDELKYNHGSSVAWFKGRWICLWNANTVRCESKPGQRIYMSVSRHGRTWSRFEAAFDNPRRSENVVPCRWGVQWQPNLIVVGDELWALWSQLSKDERYGCYVSRLRDPAGKWRNERLTWDGRPDPMIDGQRWRVLPLSNPVQLRSGRVLAPATLLGRRAADAPDSVKSWKGLEKHSSVLYTDDRGKTWRVSPGAVIPGKSWAQWEPTVWQPGDGTAMMFARNGAAGDRPQDALVWSMSRDAGATWTPYARVPLCTAISRMHVRSWRGRCIMAHNDWPAAPVMGRRYNLALFFTRGAGIDFVAGPGFSGIDPAAAYPNMWIEGDAAVISYSTGFPPRAIRIARVSPLPSPDRHYLFPRTNVAPPATPYRVGDFWRFAGHHYVTTRKVVDPGHERFSIGAWVMGSQGVILDTRSSDPSGGFVFVLKSNRPVLFLHTPERDVMPRLKFTWHEWNYVGVSVDTLAGEAIFFVNGSSERVRFTVPTPYPLRGGKGYIGAKSLRKSALPGFDGVMRMVALFANAALKPEEHHWLRNAFAESIDQPMAAPASRPAAAPALWFDPADTAAIARDFVFPPVVERGVHVATVDGRRCLRLLGEASAGVDLDENDRSRGDRIGFQFRFRIEAGDEVVLCTVGDADAPARVVVKAGRVLLRHRQQVKLAGSAPGGEWTNIAITTARDETSLRVGDRAPVFVTHNPVATWLYIGEGYPRGNAPASNRLLVDVASVRSRVARAPLR